MPDEFFVAGQRARTAHGHRARGGVVPGRADFACATCRRRCAAGARRRKRKLLQGKDLTVKEAEKQLIVRALKETDGNRTRAAKKIGMSRRTFHRKLHEYHLEGF